MPSTQNTHSLQSAQSTSFQSLKLAQNDNNLALSSFKLSQNAPDSSKAQLAQHSNNATLKALRLADNTDSAQSADSSTAQHLESSQESATDSSIEQSVNLGTITTTASPFDLDLSVESKNVLVIEKEDLQEKGFANLEQALEQQPFITFVDTGFGRNIDIRGQGKDANRAVKIMLNRVPLNSLDVISGVANFNSINLEDVESIEVIPGGGAVLYGSGTRGGVVNIVTKKPTKDFLKFNLKGTSGEAKGLQGGTISISGGKALGSRVFLNASISTNYIPGPRNTGVNEPFLPQGYLNYTATNPWANPSDDYLKGWYANCPKDPAYIDSTGKAWYYSCLQYHGGTKQGDYMQNVAISLGLQVDISEKQKLDINVNYAHTWLSRPSERMETWAVRCEPNPRFTAGGTTQPFTCTRNAKDANGTIIAGMWLQMTNTELKQWRYTASDSLSKMQNDSLQVSANYTLVPNEAWNFQALTYYNMNLIHYGFYGQPNGFGYTSLDGSKFLNHLIGLNLKAKYQVPKNMLILGLDNAWGYSARKALVNVDLETFGLIMDTYALNTAQKASISPYIYNSVHITDRFDINAGARIEYSYYRVTNAQSIKTFCDPSAIGWGASLCGGLANTIRYASTPDFDKRTNRLAYALDFSPNFKYSSTGSVYAKGELGFISPSPFQMIDADPDSEANQISQYGVVSNLLINTYNDLKPERYITAEAGIRDYFVYNDMHIDISGSVYYTHTFDEIFLNQTSGSLSYVYRNLGETSRIGFEINSMQTIGRAAFE